MQELKDLAEYKRIVNELNTYADIIDNLPHPTFVIDCNKKVIAWNKAIEKMTGVCKKDIVGKGERVHAIPFYGFPRTTLVDMIISKDWEDDLQYEHIERQGDTLIAEVFTPFVFGGKGAYVKTYASPLYNSKGKLIGAIGSIHDITEQYKIKKNWQYMATHDYLTNIPNRYLLLESLKRVVAKAKRGQSNALLLIDLDNFKLVNDNHGHAVGDDFLIALVNILKSNLREGDLLARLGGDEFAVLLEGVTPEEAGIVAERLRRSVDEKQLSLVADRLFISLTISVGIVMIDGTLDSQNILSFADTALYMAKEEGRNKVVFMHHKDYLKKKCADNNHLINIIKDALNNNLLELFYQPIFKSDDRHILYHEALLRLKGRDGQIIPPAKFLPVAERFGCMPQIDRWVLQSSLIALLKYPDLKLFINLSGISLGDEELLGYVEAAVKNSGINPIRIGFEFQEISAVKDFIKVERWTSKLKGLGCRIAIDDFGLGFSSFTYLRFLPVDYIKINGCYIYNIDKDPTQRALVQALNTVAQSLGKKTIAESVEKEGIFKILQDLKVDYVQGYYFGLPEPLPII